MSRTIRLGTRRSGLARTQAGLVAAQLRELTGCEVELVDVVTEGDTNHAPLTAMGGAGVFVSAVRAALVDGTVDAVVHSLKDLPTAGQSGIRLAAVPERTDPRDGLISDGRGLSELPDGARIGTGSPRRAAQLNALGRGFEIVDIRGNIDTRMGYVASGELDAVVLAMAGLARTSKTDRVSEILEPSAMLPAPGQGALAVEMRFELASGTDSVLSSALAEIDDASTRAATAAERAVLAETGAGCSAPLGALAEISGGEIALRAAMSSDDGIDSGEIVRSETTGEIADAEKIGKNLARELFDRLGNRQGRMTRSVNRE